MSLPLRYDVEATLLDDGRAEVTAVGERIVFDASAEQSPLPGPAHLLAAAFAGCLLKNLERSATFLRFRYANATAHVTVERRGTPASFNRIEYVLELETAEPPGRVELVHRNLLKFGPVVSTLAKACAIEGSAWIHRSARAVRSSGLVRPLPDRPPARPESGRACTRPVRSVPSWRPSRTPRGHA